MGRFLEVMPFIGRADYTELYSGGRKYKFLVGQSQFLTIQNGLLNHIYLTNFQHPLDTHSSTKKHIPETVLASSLIPGSIPASCSASTPALEIKSRSLPEGHAFTRGCRLALNARSAQILSRDKNGGNPPNPPNK
jgi:hypothetical protein